MKLDQLETFLAAAECLNFTHAGRRVHLSQSAVSQQIRELEEDLAVTLFERRGRGLLLTPAGELLRARSKPLLRDVRRAREAVGELGSQPQGVLRIGADDTPGVYLLPYALGAFARRYPGVKTSLRVADGPALVRALEAGELDVAITADPLPAARLPGWQATPIIDDELALIAPTGHEWAGRTDLPVPALVGRPLIFRQADSPTRRLIVDRIARAGVDPDRLVTLFELGNTEAIKRAIMAGLGIGWVSRYACALEREAGWLAEVGVAGLRIHRPLSFLSGPVDDLPRHQRRLLELLLDDGWRPPLLAAERAPAVGTAP